MATALQIRRQTNAALRHLMELAIDRRATGKPKRFIAAYQPAGELEVYQHPTAGPVLQVRMVEDTVVLAGDVVLVPFQTVIDTAKALNAMRAAR